ncbi:hypothetical protein BCR42DRAFT_389082 [Absidia repens]|uniref:Uncharacterized protein n=1 Tax=Absidia repens TaxID=90262 RepID=A0A1X2IS62_9FUNG|nr:hypothetical protein BCR42DRAFT_389082 [Absidia repens]
MVNSIQNLVTMQSFLRLNTETVIGLNGPFTIGIYSIASVTDDIFIKEDIKFENVSANINELETSMRNFTDNYFLLNLMERTLLPAIADYLIHVIDATVCDITSPKGGQAAFGPGYQSGRRPGCQQNRLAESVGVVLDALARNCKETTVLKSKWNHGSYCG